MPGWGTGSFENEDAQSWLATLKTLNFDQLQEIFSTVRQIDYVEARIASIAIAAAEVVAALKGAPSPVAPRAIEEWVNKTLSAPLDLREAARQTVTRVRLTSELKDLWLEADGLNDWSASLRDLEHRLSG